MKQDDEAYAKWKDGVWLGIAWLTFCDERNRKKFRALQQVGDHLGFRNYLQIDLQARIYDGELKAYGIEYGSDVGPIALPEYYFSRSAEIDWNAETVTSLGKKFEQVTVQGEREPVVGDGLPLEVVDPRLVEVDLTEIAVPMEVEINGDVELNPEEAASAAEKAPERVNDEEGSPAQAKAARGRPSRTPEIEKAIEILLNRGIDLAAMRRPQAYKEVRKCIATELNANTERDFSDPVIQRVLYRRFGRRR